MRVKVRQLDQEIVNVLASKNCSRHSLLPLLSKKISMKSLERSLTRLRKERRVDFNQVGRRGYWYTQEDTYTFRGEVLVNDGYCYYQSDQYDLHQTGDDSWTALMVVDGVASESTTQIWAKTPEGALCALDSALTEKGSRRIPSLKYPDSF